MRPPRDKFCWLVFRVYGVGLASDDPCHGLCVNCAVLFCDLGIESAQNGQLGKNTPWRRGQWCGFIHDPSPKKVQPSLDGPQWLPGPWRGKRALRNGLSVGPGGYVPNC